MNKFQIIHQLAFDPLGVLFFGMSSYMVSIAWFKFDKKRSISLHVKLTYNYFNYNFDVKYIVLVNYVI